MGPQERKLRELSVGCMPGGHIILVASSGEARKAQKLGAVRLLGRYGSATLSIPTLIEQHSRRVVFSGQKKAFGGEIPDQFVLRQARAPLDGLPAFVYVASSKDIEDASRHEPFLIVATTPNLIPRIRAELRNASTPVYLMVYSMREARAAYGRGAGETPDGLLMRFLPTSSEMDSLYRAQGCRSSGWTRDAARLIGVLSLQGDFAFHMRAIKDAITRQRMDADIRVVPVCTRAELNDVDALVLPGGWSNTQTRMMRVLRLVSPIKKIHRERKPILAVCAGMILARSKNGNRACLHRLALRLIPMAVRNNELHGTHAVIGFGKNVLFSEAPVATAIERRLFTVLARIATPGEHHGKIVGLRYRNVTAYAFHEGIHDEFLQTCLKIWSE